MESFLFDGKSKPYLSVLKGSERQPWAPVERTYRETPNRAGALLGKKRITKPRPFPIPVFLKSENIRDLQKIKEDLAAWLIHDDPKPLIPNDEPDRTYYAVVDGSFDPEDLVRWSRGTIPFVCPDPYKYGGGKSVTLGTNSINNEGTADANCIFTVTFKSAASEITITHKESGGSVRIIWNFVAGDKLEIDLTKRKVIINGNVNMTAYYWRNRPFTLHPGNNSLTIPPGSVATTQLKYRPRWK